MRLHLKRYAYAPAATLGRLRVDDETTLFTIERPWFYRAARGLAVRGRFFLLIPGKVGCQQP